MTCSSKINKNLKFYFLRHVDLFLRMLHHFLKRIKIIIIIIFSVDVTEFPHHSSISHVTLPPHPTHCSDPTPFICLTADDPNVLFQPHIHLDVNMHKICASLPPTGQIYPQSMPQPFTIPPAK